jgi:hypothetical protein
MKEIPVPYLRANQTGIVLTVVVAYLTQQPLLIGLLWIVQIAGLLFGPQANLFIIIAKPLLQKTVAEAQTEARELSRFNNALAVIFLTLSLLSFALGWKVTGYIFASMLAVAAGLAICGFCLGCVIYFQYKMIKAKKRSTK